MSAFSKSRKPFCPPPAASQSASKPVGVSLRPQLSWKIATLAREMSSPKRCPPLKPHQHLFWSSCWLQSPTLQSPQDQPERMSRGHAVQRAVMRPSCFPLEREKTNPTLNQLLAQQPLAVLLRKQEQITAIPACLSRCPVELVGLLSLL